VVARLDNVAPVLVTPDIRRTAAYYRDVLGFRVVEHFDAEEAFAATYRDRVEILLVQARHGDVVPNRVRHGAGFDVYLDPDTIQGVDDFCAEVRARGAVIHTEPRMTAYGSYEFVVEDIDGRLIGIGRIRDQDVFFRPGPG
jgi:catechol 2,3-dioxygenase-like lactoylglutathione lyase family enzyme